LKRPQWITIGAAIILTTGIFLLGRTIPLKKANTNESSQHSPNDGHNHEAAFSIDSIITFAKKKLTQEQVVRINSLEHSISRGNVKDQQIHVFHQLARFWGDSARIFEPYAWYQAEAARLENSEKNLTFAARLFLENLQIDEVVQRKQWKALQAKDLFERSLIINPANDSAKIGLGSCYLFGNISASPMEGILKIREVADRDSSNMYAQLTLVKGSLLSGQYDKAISRLLTVIRLQPDNVEAILLLADAYESTGDKANAITWYKKCLSFTTLQPDIKTAIEKRIEDLKM
jgi:tetratricopeptide (TPR) repeat protein